MIVFRADLSPQSGLSHLRRCAWLASLLEKNNRVMICSREDKKTAKFLAEKSIPFVLVKDPGALDITAVQALIFDLANSSGQDIALLNKAKKTGLKTVQVVAAGGELQPADILVGPCCGSVPPAASAPPHLAGAEYALLHHKFRHFNKVKRKYRKRIRNIFINLGDLLPYRDLRRIVEALHRLRFKMRIAPGLNLKKADKRNLMKIYPGIHFCGKSESLARAYFEADLALIPAGEEALESAAVGTPALYMSLEKKQENLAETCTSLGIGVKIPSLADFSVQNVRDIITLLTLERREQMGAAGKTLIDGLGVQRFMKVLKENGIIE
jgi:spore coat polysaccharide biosynthesis predicted glycosyltransferase SpsG